MVGVAQLVEHPVVVRDVAGSSPVAHPIFSRSDIQVMHNAQLNRDLGRATLRYADRLTFCDRYDSRQ